jgi:hypothetical protein
MREKAKETVTDSPTTPLNRRDEIAVRITCALITNGQSKVDGRPNLTLHDYCMGGIAAADIMIAVLDKTPQTKNE